ncbi:PDZ domain-containing protein [Halolactibacillus sp. JCM 19043]|uniref:PDZ domain-containing protein n=1 Tax=Halolactibacillus sp. JCM 19043 TaxID=1460638 RepID=UPI0007837FF8|nr:PDZ domain-containing protein [Halolactibacillus sp. JCM 19043]
MGKRLNLSYSQIMMVMTVTTIIIFSYLFFNNLQPFTGISVGETSESHTYVITHLHRLGWGKAVGLSEGDLIVSINDTPPSQHETIIRKMKVEQVDTLTIERMIVN